MSVRTTALVFAVAGMAIAGCGGSSAPVPVTQTSSGALRSTSTSSPIAHVVIVIQENRTFNDFFATFPGADGTTTANIAAQPNCSPPIQKGTIALTKANLVVATDLVHRWAGYRAAYNHGKMNGFDRVVDSTGKPECTYPYQYTDPQQIQPYWAMASQYTLAEHMFTTQGSDSFTAHQDLIRGSSAVSPGKAMVDLPSCSFCWWGCDAPAGTHTSLITARNVYLRGQGPFPCSTKFTGSYNTLRDLLDAKGISWKYYLPPANKIFGKFMSAFDVVAAVRYGPEWKTNVITPETAIFNDISGGSLPAVSWVIPEELNSDHPGEGMDNGPSWVSSIVNAIGTSAYWNSTAIVIVWDDWGGFYDNLPPAQVRYGGLGFRVPAIIVSPYAKPGYVSTTNYEFGSILKYIEQNWSLGSLGTSDTRARSISDCFNYSQAPIPFKPFAAKLSKEYFLREKPSYKPTDTDM
ncbi:MAG TPA: alkaline phosphatase family protein [Candidatus Cybelea sp.]|nr:alkaline phosphatase family protein [Candidatus Cybelea sp.]